MARPYRGFADLIRGRRKELGLRLDEVATAAGYSIPYLSEIERGLKQPPGHDGLQKIARALQLDQQEVEREAELSRRSVEIELEGMSRERRQLAVLLARRLDGLPEDEIADLIKKLGEGGQ